MCNKIGSYNHSQFQQLSSDQSDSDINGMTGTTGVPDGPSNNSITLTTSNCDYIDTQHKCTESTSVTLNIQENKNHEEKKKSTCPCKIPVNPGSRNPTVSENKKYACQILNQVKAQFGTASDKKPDVSQIPAQVLAQLKSNPTTRKCQLVRVYEVAESKKNNDSGKIPTARAARTRRPEPYPTRAADCNLKKCKTDPEVQNTPEIKASIPETQMDDKETEYPIINSETEEIVGTQINYPFFKPCMWNSGSGFPYLTCTICDESFAKQFIFYHLKFFHPEIYFEK